MLAPGRRSCRATPSGGSVYGQIKDRPTGPGRQSKSGSHALAGRGAFHYQRQRRPKTGHYPTWPGAQYSRAFDMLLGLMLHPHVRSHLARWFLRPVVQDQLRFSAAASTHLPHESVRPGHLRVAGSRLLGGLIGSLRIIGLNAVSVPDFVAHLFLVAGNLGILITHTPRKGVVFRKRQQPEGR